MKDAEFREWLEARRWNGKPITSVSTRMTRVRRFEKAMPALGLGAGDLDAAFDADAMDALTHWLREACKQADTTGGAPDALVGTSAKPAMQMRNVAAAVRNYRQFRSAPPAGAWPALEELRSAFLDRVPEFESFAQTDSSYERVERTYKDAMAMAVQIIAASGADDEQAGRQIYRALIPSKGPLLGWQTDDDFTRKYVELAPAFYATIGQLARDARAVAVAIMAAVERFATLREQGAGTLTPGVVAAITLTVAGMVHPESAAPFKITKGRELAKLLTGDPIFHGNVLTSEQIDAWLDLLGRIERVMRDEWGWAPRDLIDVQGFAWVALDEGWLQDEEEMDDAAVLGRFAGNPHFRAVQARWTSEQTSAFCTIARAIHTAGFDWYHVDLARNPARFGRKPDRTKPAAAVQGYLEAAGVPRIWFNDTKSSLRFGINDVPLDETSATRFVEVLFEQAEDVAAWKAPQPPRPGFWPDEAGTDRQEDTPIWIVTARNGEADGLPQFVERGEWHLLHDLGGRMNDLVREMQPGDRIVLRDFLSQKHNLPFDARGQRVTALRIRATGVVTEQRDDGLGIGVDWTVLPEPRTWYFYTKNNPVWRLRLDVEMARMLAAFIFEDAPQDYEWFTARWFGGGVSSEEQSMMPDPTNLILYGPPGTGKTYATAAQAVMLCDGLAADDPLFGETERDALMERYRALAKDERIEFVTFHQSMAYEEFVEGMRPSSVDEDGQPLAAGFRLAPTPGIFRTIAHRAELSTGPADEAFTVGERQVFKMSIGDATKAEWAWLFDEAIAEGYVYLGFGDVDWTDERFRDRAAILAAVKEHEGPRGTFTEGTEPSLQAGPVKSPDMFRNELKIGDVVVVSKGLSLFRAIGVVEGPYEYARRDDGRYSHRRKMRWLWHDDEGVRVTEINAKRLSIETVYRLSRDNLNIPALERYANSQRAVGGAPEPFVLVIDEINRANISKVFGELITLLEPDKRLGQVNELKVRLPYSGDLFGVPANLHVIGTMNTADRSIALLDTALRRRFEFREMMPDASVLPEIDGLDLERVLTQLNTRIEYLFDREHQIGHAFFMQCRTRADVDRVMRRKVLPLLAEYFHEDWGKIAAVLGDAKGERFLQRAVLQAPAGFESEYGGERYRWDVRKPDAHSDDFAANAYDGLA